jgi:hypothetical protein
MYDSHTTPQVKGKGLLYTYVWLGNEDEVAPHLLPEDAALLGPGVGLFAGAHAKRSCTTPRREMRLSASAASAGDEGIGGGGGGGPPPRQMGSLATRPKRSITNPRATAATGLLRRGAQLWARVRLGLPKGNTDMGSQQYCRPC